MTIPFESAVLVNTPVRVKAGGGQIYGWHLLNLATTPRYVRLFDSLAAPTMGTTLASIVLGLPANSSAGSGAGACMSFSDTWAFQFVNGIWVAVTAALPDNDNTAGSAGDVLVNLFWN
jgi:hypothetical protein